MSKCGHCLLKKSDMNSANPFIQTPQNASATHHHRQIGTRKWCTCKGGGGGCNFGRFWRRSCSLMLFEDEAGHVRVNQMSHFTVNINLACAECGPPQLLQGASEEMSHISLPGDRLEIKVLIIHSGLLPGNRPPLAEHVC